MVSIRAMDEITQTIETLDRPLADLDLTPGGQVLAVTEMGKGTAKRGQRLLVNGQPLPVPEPTRHPILRALDEDRLLLADARTRGSWNAWVLRTTGEVERTFWAGDAIEDIVPLQSWLAVAYFDQASFENHSDGLCGVVLFDANGEVAFRHNESGSGDQIMACYCACWAGRDRLLFMGSSPFQVVLLDANTKQETVWQAPNEIRRASAVTLAGGIAFFHGTYEDPEGIYRWRLGDQKAERIGEHAGPLRGLPKGRFLSQGDNGFTILSLTDEVK